MFLRIFLACIFLNPTISAAKSMRYISPEDSKEIQKAVAAKDSKLCFGENTKKVLLTCVKNVAVGSSDEKHCLILESLIDRAACIGEYSSRKKMANLCDKYFIKTWNSYSICTGRLKKK